MIIVKQRDAGDEGGYSTEIFISFKNTIGARRITFWIRKALPLGTCKLFTRRAPCISVPVFQTGDRKLFRFLTRQCFGK